MENQIIEEKKRPDFLTFLCVLSFINIAFWIVFYTMFSFMGNPGFLSKITEALESTGKELPEEFGAMMQHAGSIGVSNVALSIISLVGVILMFKLNKTGFYLYVFAQLLILFVYPIIIGMNQFSFFSLILPAIWIGIYASNLKYMNVTF